MKKVVAMTIHSRTPEVLHAVFAGLAMPGNKPDVLAVCFDRASPKAVKLVRFVCDGFGINLRSAILDDDTRGPRCPSEAWNAALNLVGEDHVFCLSSDTVLAPHSLDMAYHLSAVAPEAIIVGRAEHCGQSYVFTHEKEGKKTITDRMMTTSWAPSPLGFLWLLPMAKVRAIGGYDEDYMDGLCYEDADFALRMWNAGADLIFCDDMVGFHLEHKRDHLADKDGRVATNAKRFAKTYGDVDYLRCLKFGANLCTFGVGMCSMTHAQDGKMVNALERQQRSYNHANQALPVRP